MFWHTEIGSLTSLVDKVVTDLKLKNSKQALKMNLLFSDIESFPWYMKWEAKAVLKYYDANFMGTKIFKYIFTQRVNLEIHRPRY